MRRAGTESGLLGFCRKFTRDIFQLADPLRLSDGGKLPLKNFSRRRLLAIEPLEIRNLLAGNSVAAIVDPVWFQEVANGAQSHAGVANWTAQGISSTNAQQMVSIDGASDTHDWIVQFNTQYVAAITDIAQTVNLLSGGGIQFQAIAGLGIVGQVLVRSSGASLDTVEHWLADDAHVASFEQDAVRQIESTPNDPSLGSLWGMTKIDAYSAWNLSTGATGNNRVVVAEIDTGVDYTHPDLAANIWTNANVGKDGFAGDLHGYDFANNDGDPMDDNGHGTHVAGTIGAVGNNGIGVSGVNWAVSIMPLKFMAASGAGYLSDAIRAINYATMERTQFGVNVRVINASWGGGGFSSAMQTAITAAGNAGILFVAAAGNDGANNDASPHYPANYAGSNVISVAATDQNDALASFSDYGATTVDLAAPGVAINSTLPGNKYGVYSGTSMATPHVAGAAALAWAFNPNATVEDIRNALLQSVDRIAGLSGKMVSGGRLNVFHALQYLQGNYNPTPVAPTLGSLTSTANNILPGTSFDLVASGATAASGNVTAVYFYADLNNNGVFDSSDFPIGADYNPVGGVGRLHISGAGLAAGTYRFFARALDSSYRFSDAAQTTVTISGAGMTNFAISANDVLQGTTVSLVAQGLPTGANGIRDVYFYADLNNNGVFDAADFPIGASANANGTAQLSMNTAGMAPGVYRYFARALNTNYKYGEPLAQTLTVRQSGLQSLTLSADNVTAGTTVQLLAQCSPAIAANTEAVYYYSDINNNGVFDSADFPIGADANLVNGSSKLTISTTNWAPGTYRFFARALDMQYHFGPASTATLTVVASSSQSAPAPTPSATSIAAGATLTNKLEAGGKEVWFQFHAVAGNSYTIRTELVTLRDSVLFLYDTDGKTLLASNDDGDSGLASRIDWTAPKNGTYFFKVSAFDKTLTGDFRVSLLTNSRPLNFVANAPTNSEFSGISPRIAALPAATAFTAFRTEAIGNRLVSDSAIIEGILRNDAPSATLLFDPGSTTSLDAAIVRCISIAPQDAISSTTDAHFSDPTNTLLENQPALRSILHAMLFETPADAADTTTPLQIDMESIDALFAQMAEEGWDS